MMMLINTCQVSLPHYLTKQYLKDAVERYKKFLFLKCTHPKEFLVPCYDMDIVWHAHMVSLSIYFFILDVFLLIKMVKSGGFS